VRPPQGLRSAQSLIAISAILYGTQGIFASLAYEAGASVGVALLARALAISLLALFLLDRTRRATLRGRSRPIAIACFASIAGPLLFFAAVRRMDPATVTLIFFVYPALTLLGARLRGRIQLTPLAIGVTAATLIGVALAIGSPSGSIDPLGIVLSLGFALVLTGYFLAAEQGLEGIDPLAWLGITVLVPLFVFIPLAPLLGGITLPTTNTGFVALIGVGVVAALLPAILQTIGLIRLGSAATALVATLEIATVVLLTAVVLGDIPTPLSLLGAALVCVGAASAPYAIRRRARSDITPAG
jgi:drug/metabolite transporter (DMT)-like permease